MRKGPTMKLTNLIWVLALAGSIMACNSGPPITNVRPPPPTGTGGTTGTGGAGGAATGKCTGPEDSAVYAELTFIDADGVESNGPAAASAIGSACIFGTDASVPKVTGCSPEGIAVLSCSATGCDQATIDALGDCVALCTQETTAGIAPPGLSTECMACTGDTVACGAGFCVSPCSADTTLPGCVACRCDAGCTPAFDVCSGLPDTGACG